MTKKISNSYAVGNDGQQNAERTLLEYLKPKQEDRFSKLEAYCDLLSRASAGAYTCQVADKKVDLLPGQFVATVSDLARTWQWQRATVRQFLEGLVAIGQLQMIPFVKSYIFTIDLCKRMSIAVEETCDVLAFCKMQYARYTDGRMPAEEVASSFDYYFEMMAEKASNSDNASHAMLVVLESQLQIFNSMLSFLYNKNSERYPLTKPVIDASRLLFGREGLWKWQNVLSCLDILSSAFSRRLLPSSMDDLKSQQSEAELSLMDAIYTSYTSHSTNPTVAPESAAVESRTKGSSLDGGQIISADDAPDGSTVSEDTLHPLTSRTDKTVTR